MDAGRPVSCWPPRRHLTPPELPSEVDIALKSSCITCRMELAYAVGPPGPRLTAADLGDLLLEACCCELDT